jgi:hypothetical protein
MMVGVGLLEEAMGFTETRRDGVGSGPEVTLFEV